MYQGDVTRELLIKLRRGFRGLKNCLGRKKADTAVTGRSKKKPADQAITPPAADTEEFFTFKTAAAIRVVREALESRRPLDLALSDLKLLYSELRPVVQTLFGTSDYQSKSGDDHEACERYWKEIGDALNSLCLVQDGSIQTGFLHISFAAANLQKSFKRIQLLLGNWSKHWGTCYHTDDLDQIVASAAEVCEPKTEPEEHSKDGDESLKPDAGDDRADNAYPEAHNEHPNGRLYSLATKAEQLALDAAKSCSPEEQKHKLKKLCAKLIAIHERFEEITCILDRLQCSPDIEPTFHELVNRRLARAAVFLQAAFAGAQTISVECKDTASVMIGAWECLQSAIPALEHEIAAFAQRQLCQPPGLCASQLSQLHSVIDEGLHNARSLHNRVIDLDATHRQFKLLESVQTVLMGLERGGLRKRTINAFSLCILQIRAALSRCHEEAEPECVVTKEDLVHIMHYLKSACAGMPSYQVYQRCPPTYAPTGAQTPYGVPQSAGVSKPAFAGGFIKVWSRWEKLLTELHQLAPVQLKPQVNALMLTARQQQQRLNSAQMLSSVPYSTLVRKQELHLKQLWAGMNAALAVTYDKAAPTDKRTIAALQLRLPELKQQMQDAGIRETGGAQS